MKKIIVFSLLGILKVFAQNCVSYTTANSQIPSNVTWGIYIDAKNRKWIGSSGGLSVYNDTIWQNYNTNNSNFPSNLVREISTTSKDEIWVGAITDGVYRLKGGSWTFYNTGNSNLPSTTIYDIYTDNKDTVWVATDLGIAKFNGTNWVKYNTSNVSNFPSPNIYDIDKDKNNKLLLGSQPQGSWMGGLGILENLTYSLVYKTTTHAIASNFISCSKADSIGNIWIGTNNGLSFYNIKENTWTTYNTNNSSLPSNTISDIEIYYGIISRIWVTTNLGLTSYNLNTNKWESAITTLNSCIGTNNLNDLEIDQHGNVWLTGVQGGLTMLNRNVITNAEDATNEDKILNMVHIDQATEIYALGQIEIYNTLGKRVLMADYIEKSKVDISNLPNGIYIVQVLKGKNSEKEKLLIYK